MKTLLTPTPLIAYEIEVCDYEPKINDKNELTIMCEIALLCHLDDLEGEHEIIGFCDKGVIDFEVVKIIPTYFHFTRQMTVYQDYNNPNDIDSCYISARNSFISLLESHSLSLDKKYLIIKPKN